MAQKKETNKKGVKVQDLAPKKDAKGGRFSSNASQNANMNASSANASLNSSANENRSLDGANYSAD